MRYKFFNNSQKSWGAMHLAIENAKESVYLEMYIFDESMEGKYDFLKALKAKAVAGLDVRVILDSLGSQGLGRRAVEALRHAGAEVYFVSHLFRRTHRKILIIDKKEAYVGGVNFTARTAKWDDLVLRVRGSILVHSLLRSFARAYNEVQGKDREILAYLEKGKKKKINSSKIKRKLSSLVEHLPGKRRFELQKIYREALSRAKESIVIITPYFVPPRKFLLELERAVLRGVSVEILVPRSTDHFVFVDKANYFCISRASHFGVKFFIEPKMNHGKAMIVDGREALVGSQNFDFLSFDYNDEIGIFIRDIKAVERLKDIVAEWKKKSKPFDTKTHPPSRFYFFLAPIIRLFVRIL